MIFFDYVYYKFYNQSKNIALQNHNAIYRLSLLKICNCFSIIFLVCIILKKTFPFNNIEDVVWSFLIIFYESIRYRKKNFLYIKERINAIDSLKYDRYSSMYIIFTLLSLVIFLSIYLFNKNSYTQWNILFLEIKTGD